MHMSGAVIRGMYRRPKNGGFTGILSLKKDSEEISQIFEGKKLPSVLGSDRFIDWVKDKFFHQKNHARNP